MEAVRGRGIAVTALIVAAGLSACEFFQKSPTAPAASPRPTTAALDIAITPDPLKILWVCPLVDTNCYGSLDSTITISETAGVGGLVDSVDFVARDSVLGVQLTQLHLSATDIKAKVGTNRIEPLGKLAVRPIIEGYPVPAKSPRPTLVIDVAVQMTDDKGNVVKKTRSAPVT